MKTARFLISLSLFLACTLVCSLQSIAGEHTPELSSEPSEPFEITTSFASSFVDIIPHRLYTRAIDYFEEGWFEIEHEDWYWGNVTFLEGLDEWGRYQFTEPCIYHAVGNVPEAYIRGNVWWEAGFESENPVRKVIARVGANEDFEFYLNGSLVGSESNGMVGPIKVYDVTSLWQVGSGTGNVFAVHVSNVGYGSLYITIRVYFGQSD